jgi:Protein of unknown function (DUF2845)
VSKQSPLLVAACLALVADPALAFRCKSRIVTAGDPQAKVLRFCGEPVSTQQRVIYRGGIPRSTVSRTVIAGDDIGGVRSSREELLIHDRSVVEVLVEEWTYNLGPHKLMRIVRFENGLVTEVRQLGYGYHD